MSNVKINHENVENTVSALKNTIQSEIIDASTASGNNILNAIENSSGEFIEAFKEEINRETEVIKEVGELLIAIVDYVQSAANAFEAVDDKYNDSKLNG